LKQIGLFLEKIDICCRHDLCWYSKSYLVKDPPLLQNFGIVSSSGGGKQATLFDDDAKKRLHHHPLQLTKR